MVTQRTFIMKVAISTMHSANKEPIEIAENDLSDSERDGLLKL